MDKMTLQELEHAVMSPRLFVKSVNENSARRTVPAHRTRTLQDLNSDQRIHVYSLFLVPGGRFLVTAGRDKVCLWDLGYSVDATTKPYALATLERADFYLHAVVPSSDQKEPIVAIQLERSEHTHSINGMDLIGYMKPRERRRNHSR